MGARGLVLDALIRATIAYRSTKCMLVSVVCFSSDAPPRLIIIALGDESTNRLRA